MNEERPGTLLQNIQRVRAFMRAQIKWFTRLSIGILFLFFVLLLNPITSDIVQPISTALGLKEPSLMTIIGVAILFFILERIIVIEDGVIRGTALPLRTYLRRDEAYADLSKQLSSSKVGKVDLLQFSGDTARELLRAVAKHSPNAEIRMLLFDPDYADQFDSDSEDHHSQRIKWTVNAIKVLEEDFAKDGFMVDIRYYMATPSVSAVVVDHKVVSVSWYRTYLDGDVMRLRGHSSATITGSGESAAPLLSFAQTQFDALWNRVEVPSPDA